MASRVTRIIVGHDVVLGDFVTVSGTSAPIGLVTEVVASQAKVSWLTNPTCYSLMPAICLETVTRVA